MYKFSDHSFFLFIKNNHFIVQHDREKKKKGKKRTCVATLLTQVGLRIAQEKVI
jgi:hypothetical protein